MGAEGTALGGAISGFPNRGDFIYANPALPAFEEKYSLGFAYGTAGDQLKAQIIDTKSSKLGGGVSFSQRKVENVESFEDAALGNFNRVEHSAVVSLMTKVSDSVAVGVSAHHRYLRASGLPSNAYWSGDLGIAVKLDPEWTLGLAGLDLIADDYGYSYRTLNVGVSGRVADGLTVTGQLDFVRNPEGSEDTGFVVAEPKPSFGIGAEYLVRPEFRLRASYKALPSWEQNYLGAGFGYRKDSFGIDYGFRLSTKNSKGQYHTISLSVDI
jgi:hypothetical protein